jgi:SAM-dependent methyltransferase
MRTPVDESQSYDDLYRDFDSPLQQQLRREAYGKDIGQHSWVTAEELEQDIERLRLSRQSCFLDLGCGPGGPLSFIVEHVRCQGSGLDVSTKAIAAARARAVGLGLHELITLREADLNEPMPFANGLFDAVISLDVILHLRDRLKVFREVARILVPGGRFLFTDAGVITGAISDEEIRWRSLHGYTQFVSSGYNEKTLELAGFRITDRHDRTASLLKNATGRLAARLAHREELQKIEGVAHYGNQQRYIETVIKISQMGSVSRVMYLAESLVA